jgi:carbon-monoxide dehydrogenase medium subunit
MKPATFDYIAPRSAEEAVAALAGPDTHVLAGGQSLVLEMNFRNLRPARLVDINHVPGFDVVRREHAALEIGPLVRHRAFEKLLDEGPLSRLLKAVVHHIAHPPIRARGTMVGSLAYAHPAAEWPAVAVTLDAELELTDTTGRRTIAAEYFFLGPFRTARRPDELITALRLPEPASNAGIGFVEHRRTSASFADLAALAVVRLGDGKFENVRIGLVNAAPTPVRARTAERLLIGRTPSSDALKEAGCAAGEQDADPGEQPHAGISYQRHAIAVIVGRAVEAAVHDADSQGRSERCTSG